MPTQSAICYIDGFNLYYRLLRRTSYKWLNLSSLFNAILTDYKLLHIHYFTADLHSGHPNRDRPIRQGLYLRAIKTLPNLTITKGYYLRTKVWAQPVVGTDMVQVWKSEEKGSDVNIGTQMLVDAHLAKSHVQVIVSNDTDLVAPIKAAQEIFGLKVLLVSPVSNPSRKLVDAASEVIVLHGKDLSAHLFPEELTDAKGSFRKPSFW